MITIDFEIDEEELIDSLDSEGFELVKTGQVSFVVTLFIMPVRFKVNETEVFGYKDSPWSPMPIINVASNGLLTVKDLKKSRIEEYELMEEPGVFYFSMIDEQNVKMKYDGFRKVELIVNYNELLEAFQTFADKVRAFLKEVAPQIDKHPYWGPWLRGERD